MEQIMVDLETMGTRADAPVIAIGAVRMFRTYAPGAEHMRTFYTTIDLRGQEHFGRHIDPATVLWWMKQSDDARKEFAEPNVSPGLPIALRMFSEWCATFSTPETLCVWGNGASFDNVLLRESYRATHLTAPWLYRNDRCYRTLKSMYPTIAGPALDVNKAHHALYDAERQAEHLETIAFHCNGALK